MYIKLTHSNPTLCLDSWDFCLWVGEGRNSLLWTLWVGGRSNGVRVEGWLWCVIWGGKFSAPHYHFIHDILHGSLQLLTKRRLGQSCPCYYHFGRGRHLFIIRPLLDFDVKWAVANFSPCVGGFGGLFWPNNNIRVVWDEMKLSGGAACGKQLIWWQDKA